MKTHLSLIINNEHFFWNDQYITGVEIKNLGKIPADDVLFLAIKRPWVDELIENETRVDLARPGIEHFYSKKHDEHPSITLIVNGRKKDWFKRTISYAEIAKLAFPELPVNDLTVFTVTYTDGPGQNQEGSMVKGDIVFVKEKMNFNVTATNKS